MNHLPLLLSMATASARAALDAARRREEEATHGEHHGSIFPFLTALSAVLVLAGLIVPASAFLGLALLAFSLVGWAREVLPQLHAVEHAHRTLGWSAMALLIVTEIVLFTALFFYWFWARGYATEWPPAGIPEMDLTLPAINTVILLSSGGTAFLAERALAKDQRRLVFVMLLVTILLGVIFILGQVQEYAGAGFTWKNGTYGSAFFALTGTHGAHVIIGLVVLSSYLFLAATGRVTRESHKGLPAAAIYWHFVDIVWVFLFLIVYLRVV